MYHLSLFRSSIRKQHVLSCDHWPNTPAPSPKPSSIVAPCSRLPFVWRNLTLESRNQPHGHLHISPSKIEIIKAQWVLGSQCSWFRLYTGYRPFLAGTRPQSKAYLSTGSQLNRKAFDGPRTDSAGCWGCTLSNPANQPPLGSAKEADVSNFSQHRKAFSRDGRNYLWMWALPKNTL